MIPTTSHGRRRVLIADDEETIRDALSDLIRTDPGLEVVGVAEDARQAADLAESTQPDVALVDVRMPGGGVSAVRAMGIRSPHTRVVALSASGSPDTVLDMLRAGAVGYLVKGAMPAVILEAVHRVAEGRSALSPEIADSVVRDLSDRLQADSDEIESRQRRMEQIDQALSGDAMSTVFQPIVELSSRRVLGYEALSRFHLSPPQPPEFWFAEAADLGRGVELEVAAIRAAGRLRSALPGGAYLSVNASPDTVIADLGQEALAALADDGLVVEVTEHAPVDDYDRLRAALAPLAAQGVRLAVDDVGAGFASLRHIVKLGPDIIKLDVALTAGIDTDVALQAVAGAMISFAARTGVEIIAEGVETIGELNALIALGVDRGQGFLLGRPEPPVTA
jgi:EAL domain-containing protein (putative c-di-GMP-specific phosphodiesterase class I)/DNA-binding NarL/FixJ family response regulator